MASGSFERRCSGVLNKLYYDDSEGYNDLKRNDIECKSNDIV